MSTQLAWVILGVGSAIGFQLLAPNKYCKGRITRLCQKVIPAHGFNIRLIQLLMFLWPISVGIDYVVGNYLGVAIYNGGWIVLCLDDYLFGDDDDWKRFREWAKNKVKWKMDLPQPVRAKE